MSVLTSIRRRREGLSYEGNTFFWMKNVAITSAFPTAPKTYTIPGTGAFSIVAGAFPTGIALDADTGEISGTPTDEDYFKSVTIAVTGTDGKIRKTVIRWHSQVIPAIEYDQPDDWTAGVEIDALAVSSTGGQVKTYSQSGLPSGVTINAVTGEITGTPDEDLDESGTATITATGPTGLTDTFDVDWVVLPAP